MAITDEKRALPTQQPPQQQKSRDDVSETLMTDGFQLPDIDPGDGEPPPYGEHHDHVQFSQPGFEAGAAVTGMSDPRDGRVNININTKNRRLADLLAPTLQSQVAAALETIVLPPAYIPPSLGGQPGQVPPPQLNVVIQIVGSRGDVQPFVALGKVLKDTYGHRVRIATHPTFQTFVEENDLEFFSIGGDPAELMAFMVKHPGLMPGFDAITSGEVSKRRRGIQEILMGCWRSCIEAGNGLGPPPTPHAKGAPFDASLELQGEPFVADAIIANPPSFAHIHIAEKTGIPLHMMFTMPWSPTRAFPHPLANIQSSNADDVMTNYMSYTLVEMMTWQGLGDVINRFRDKALDLPPLSLIWAPGLLSRLKVSWTYCWSPALIPKPNDWGRNIDIAGFYFLNLASSFTPDPQLEAFLRDGPPPVYIGFGSIVVDDPDAMTRTIFDAVKLSGVRALVSKGWGGLGADDLGIPDGVFMLGNVPHDWLFEHVSCVVHHGGAGTTAAGIKAGKPTLVVPFFGDQPFWGSMTARAKAGPDPIPYKELTAENLAEALRFCIKPETLEQATQLGQKIREEKGTDIGGKSFHDHIDLEKMRCSVSPSRAAAWRVRRTQFRLSPFAAAVLVEEGLLEYSSLKLYRYKEYITEDQPPDPISACACSLVADLGGIGMAIADMPRDLFKSFKKVKENNESQPQPTGETGKPAVSPSESVATMPHLSEPDSSSTNPPSETTRASTMPTSHSNISQPSISDASSTFSSTLSPAATSSQRPTSSRSSKLSQTISDLDFATSNRAKFDAAVGTGQGVGRIVSTGVKSPMNFCLGLAKGFRNIPKLYNDDTIRPVEKVTDFSTGIKVAGKELGYGFFDGVAGLVTQPWKGAEKEGAPGLVKGFGKGIGGLIAKPAAGIWGIPAYTMQGVHAEINKFFTRSVQNYIISSRAIQGQREMQTSTPEERADIIKRWNNSKFDLKNHYVMKRKGNTAGKLPANQQTSESGLEAPKTGWLQTRRMSFEERKKLQASRDEWKKGYIDVKLPDNNEKASDVQTMSSEDTELEAAIQASVQKTSHGNDEEDAMVEAAIRESIRAVRDRAQSTDTAGPLPTKDMTIFDDHDYQITDEEYQDLVQKAIEQSMVTDSPLPQESGFVELDSMETTVLPPPQQNDGDDAELQRAIEESRNEPAIAPGSTDNDAELQRAIAASKEVMEKETSQRTEEDIVVEYVKKQSLAEEEFRRQRTKGKGTGLEETGEEDEELQRAMEESLRMNRGDDSGPSRT
ncbi:Sterol 3-beta-glucosyltransferase UGT80B1 [Neonectria ditissima]|uniref:Sterol 3-beta-glucosyltransferase UGT80B1 n=2 Tax=Eukaryota TaxID=2759 RepID=A0A0P7BQP6_9HYPO|nr:Sterol 3-beta-glucosyltransferase UGT80B1 [Neonectria ditissima]